jgi:hypothetical protein
LVKKIKKRKRLNDRKQDNNRKQAAQKRSIEYPDQLKQVENDKKWKEFTDPKPGSNITYKGSHYGEKDEHQLMKAIIAQMKSYNITMNKRENNNKKIKK